MFKNPFEPTAIAAVLNVALFVLIQPSPCRAETDYGKLFYSIPLASSIEEVERLLTARKGYKVRTSKNKDGSSSVLGNFNAGVAEIQFRDSRISMMRYQAGLFPLKTVRGIDTYFVKNLGPMAYVRFKNSGIYFGKTSFDACLKTCAPHCGQHAPSAFYCEKGRNCQSACLTKLLPTNPGKLQQFIYERVSNEDGQYASYWACNDRAKSTRVAFDAPTGCFMTLRVDNCRAIKPGASPEKSSCMYTMTYFDR